MRSFSSNPRVADEVRLRPAQVGGRGLAAAVDDDALHVNAATRVAALAGRRPERARRARPAGRGRGGVAGVDRLGGALRQDAARAAGVAAAQPLLLRQPGGGAVRRPGVRRARRAALLERPARRRVSIPRRRVGSPRDRRARRVPSFRVLSPAEPRPSLVLQVHQVADASLGERAALQPGAGAAGEAGVGVGLGRTGRALRVGVPGAGPPGPAGRPAPARAPPGDEPAGRAGRRHLPRVGLVRPRRRGGRGPGGQRGQRRARRHALERRRGPPQRLGRGRGLGPRLRRRTSPRR